MEKNNRTAFLLVEDEPDDVLFVRMATKHSGLVNLLQVVEDGSAAIAYLGGDGVYANRTLYPLPCLVLLDMKLPHVMGLDVLKWIRDRPAFDTTIVIMLTSSRHSDDVRRAYALGANAFLVKPSNPHALAEMMEAIKRFWLTFNHPTAAGGGSSS